MKTFSGLKMTSMAVLLISVAVMGCQKESSMPTSAPIVDKGMSKAWTSVAFVMYDDVVATGAINATGSYDMAVNGHGNYMAIHCNTVCTFPLGTITIRMDCQFGNDNGVWHIVSGTGAYTGLEGNGQLYMDETGEHLSGKIYK